MVSDAIATAQQLSATLDKWPTETGTRSDTHLRITIHTQLSSFVLRQLVPELN